MRLRRRGKMNDRELLEKAAKAAGIELEWWDAGCPGFYSSGDRMGLTFTNWNPLTDDGDALRLAVKLHIRITPGEMQSSASWWVAPDFITEDFVTEMNGTDPYAATRRAITRAAAGETE